MGLRNFVCGAVVGGRSVFLGQLAGGLEMDQNGNCCGPTLLYIVVERLSPLPQ